MTLQRKLLNAALLFTLLGAASAKAPTMCAST